MGFKKKFLSVFNFLSIRSGFILIILLLIPLLTYAQIATLDGLALEMLALVRRLVSLVFALALLFFLWGLARFVASAGNPQAREGAKSIMIWGVLALFIMASVWGIVFLLQTTFKVDKGIVVFPTV